MSTMKDPYYLRQYDKHTNICTLRAVVNVMNLRGLDLTLTPYDNEHLIYTLEDNNNDLTKRIKATIYCSLENPSIPTVRILMVDTNLLNIFLEKILKKLDGIKIPTNILAPIEDGIDKVMFTIKDSTVTLNW